MRELDAKQFVYNDGEIPILYLELGTEGIVSTYGTFGVAAISMSEDGLLYGHDKDGKCKLASKCCANGYRSLRRRHPCNNLSRDTAIAVWEEPHSQAEASLRKFHDILPTGKVRCADGSVWNYGMPIADWEQQVR